MSLGCERNLQREYMMKYFHPKAKGKTFATTYTVQQDWFPVSDEKTDINLKLLLRHIDQYANYLNECTEPIKNSVVTAIDCGPCVKNYGGITFEFNNNKYCKCPWHVFRFNDSSKQALDNYIKLIELESQAL